MGVLSNASEKLADRKAGKKVRKAEDRAVHVRAKAKAKAESSEEQKIRKKELKSEQKRHKREQATERKGAKATAKAQKKVAEAEAKTASENAKVESERLKAEAESGLFTPDKVKRYMTVGRMVSPILAPVAYRGAVAARAQFTEVKARRAGVSSARLNQYGGPSAVLRARIATARESADRVAAAEQNDESRAFVQAMTARLDNLQVAADAADRMPSAQRKSAQRSIDDELAAIDNDLLARLNVHPR